MGAYLEKIEVEGHRLFVFKGRIPYISDIEVFKTLDIVLTTLLSEPLLHIFISCFSTHPVRIACGLACLLPGKLAADWDAFVGYFEQIWLAQFNLKIRVLWTEYYVSVSHARFSDVYWAVFIMT